LPRRGDGLAEGVAGEARQRRGGRDRPRQGPREFDGPEDARPDRQGDGGAVPQAPPSGAVVCVGPAVKARASRGLRPSTALSESPPGRGSVIATAPLRFFGGKVRSPLPPALPWKVPPPPSRATAVCACSRPRPAVPRGAASWSPSCGGGSPKPSC